MSLKLRVKEGANKGLEMLLVDGLEIGREAMLFPLLDNKVSTRHGVFRQDSSGAWAFLDLGSKNGTFLAGKRVEKIDLVAGASFRVGDTILEVVSPEDVGHKKKTWAQILETAFLQARELLTDEPKTPIPFFKPLRIQILSGPQIETSWLMAFGPRLVGRGSEDFPIYLEDAPEICFEVVPHSQGVTIINHAENFVFFNDSSFREQSVLPGDRIKLGSMEMVLDYL